MADPILVEATLAKAVIDSYTYFNTNYDDSLIDMVVAEIMDAYKMHSLVEILQAIKTGKRQQEKIYGKLSPAHILDWVKLFDNQMTPTAVEFQETSQRVLSGDRSDKYAEPMTKEEQMIFKKLAQRYVQTKKQERTAKQKVDEVYLNHLENQKKIAEYNKNPEKYGDFDEYINQQKTI